jgi:hypothetical protein
MVFRRTKAYGGLDRKQVVAHAHSSVCVHKIQKFIFAEALLNDVRIPDYIFQ